MHLVRIGDRFINLDHVVDATFWPAGVAGDEDEDVKPGTPFPAKLTLYLAHLVENGVGFRRQTIHVGGESADALLAYMTKQACTLNPRTPPKRIPPAPVAAGNNTPTTPSNGEERS